MSNDMKNDTQDFDISDLCFDQSDLDEISGKFPDPEIPDFDEDNLMRPPWLKYPNISYGSIGWRMGAGEVYIEKFLKWYKSRTEEAREAYQQKYCEDDKWSGFYTWIEP